MQRSGCFKKCLVICLRFWAMSGGVHAEEVYQLEAVTVTAEKREENIQKVPVAITAFTETELEDAGAETISDVIDMIPGLMLEPMGSAGWSLAAYRGSTYSAFTGKNPLVIFIDGIPYDNSGYYDLELMDVERVEVLRGPQGTLYGKNAMAGVINIITKKPTHTVASKLTTRLAEHETCGIKGFVNGPVIKDKLFLGVSAKYYETEGFMKNDNPDEDYFDSEENKTAKALLRWLPSERLALDLHAGIDQRRDGSGRIIASDHVCYHENKHPDGKSDLDSASSALNVTYAADFAELNSITTCRFTETDYWEDRTYMGTGIVDNFDKSDITSVSQEFRIQSPSKQDKVKWLAGLYYSNEDRDSDEYGLVYDTEAYYGYNMKYDWPYDQTEQAMAVFGQLTVPLFAAVDFTAGLRYETIEKEVDYTCRVTRTDTGDMLSLVEWNQDENWDALLPKAVLSWSPSGDVMLYCSVAQGYLAGGLNPCEDNKDAAKFDEQTSLNYEIGGKTAWLENRLFLNTTLFYTDIEDMHVWNNPEPGIWVASNAASAHAQGVEIEARVKPLQGLDIMASFAWMESEFDDYGEYTGNTTLQTPDYTYNLSAQYRHSSGFFMRGEVEGYGKTYYDEANLLKRDPFDLVNVRIGYEAANWDVYLYADNLFDKEYFSSIGLGYYTVGEPQTVGLMASVRF